MNERYWWCGWYSLCCWIDSTDEWYDRCHNELFTFTYFCHWMIGLRLSNWWCGWCWMNWCYWMSRRKWWCIMSWWSELCWWTRRTQYWSYRRAILCTMKCHFSRWIRRIIWYRWCGWCKWCYFWFYGSEWMSRWCRMSRWCQLCWWTRRSQCYNRYSL